jgi:hypothetical protein
MTSILRTATPRQLQAPSLRTLLRRFSVSLVVVSLLLSAMSSMPAQAANLPGCRASALRATGLGIVATEPSVANDPATPCATQSSSILTLPPSLSSILSVDVASASTTAASGLAGAQSGVVAPLFAGVLGGIKLSALTADATERCISGVTAPSSSSQVIGLSINGASYGTSSEARTIDIPSLGTLYLNRTIAGSGGVTQRAFELALLPSLPGGLAGLDLVLGEASASGNACSGELGPGGGGGGGGGGGSTGSGGGPPAGAGGRGASGADGSGLGAASGVSGGVLGFRQAAARLAMACTQRKLVLIDVLMRGNHVALFGAAEKSLIGRRVAITFAVGHKRVASTVVGADGFFGATAPLPARRLRFTNLARYQASVGGERSKQLKLTRRMIVNSISASRGKVVMRGRVVRPLARPIATILLKRRVSCSSSVVIKRIKPRPDGTFTARFAAPPRTQAAVYEAATRVRRTRGNRRTFPTSTLPRMVVNR